MALASTIVWEVRTDGNDTNGGGFKTGASGTDWTQQAAAQYSVTDGVTAGTTTITSATANFGTDVVGNVMYVQGGTGSVTAGWYEITSRTNSTTVVVDRSTGLTAGTGVTLKIGGALASPGMAGGVSVNGNTVYIKAGTYTLGSSSANVATGKVYLSAGNQTWIGYNSTRGDNGTRPVITNAAYTSLAIFETASNFNHLSNISVDGNNQTGTTGVYLNSARTSAYRVHAANCKSYGINASATTNNLIACSATGCSSGTAAIYGNGWLFLCVAYSNTITGILMTGPGLCSHCLSLNNTGSTSVHGFMTEYYHGGFINCTAYGNQGDGFYLEAYSVEAINCLAENNRYGFNASGSYFQYARNCGTYNNSSGKYNTSYFSSSNVFNHVDNTTASFFTNAAGNNFTLNNTASAGAAARAAGMGTEPAYSNVGYQDIGALQHQDAGGGGLALPVSGGIIA